MERLTFDRIISKRIDLQDQSILLFSGFNDVVNIFSEIKVPDRRNVCSLDKDGKILWWIQEIPEFILQIKPSLKSTEVYEGWKDSLHNNIWIEEEKLKTFISDGYFFTVDLNTGRILKMESEKN